MRDQWQEYYRRGWWRRRTFLDDLGDAAAADPGKPAVVDHRADGGGRVVGYGELAAAVDRYAGALVALGVEPGQIVAVQLPNWWEAAALPLACARAGVAVCPVLPFYGRRELAHILGLTEARVLVTVPAWQEKPLASWAVELAGELPRLDHVVVAGGQGPAGTVAFDEAFGGAGSAGGPGSAGRGGELDRRQLGPDDPWQVLFTSGTTGEAKGVVHSQNTLYAACRGYLEVLGLDGGLVTSVTHALTHQAGFGQGLLAALLVGGTQVWQDTWDGDVLLDLVERHRVTQVYGAPTFQLDVLDAQEARPRDVGSLERVVTGSAPVPPHLVERIRDVLGVRTFSLWGMTENGTVTITGRDDPQDWAAHSDGRPIEGMEVRIDPAGLEDQPSGTGRLLVRGAAQCLGYLHRDELYAAALDDDGWFDTGDLARDDGRGGIRVAGRVKEIVIAHGFNVPVPEVEAALAAHPKVREVAVVGVTDPDADEQVCAVVTAAGEPPTLEELRAHLEGQGMMPWFWPARLEVVDDLPKTTSGKVRKVELRERLTRA
jgi:cyclohexanecarboxylate-CoA ligase